MSRQRPYRASKGLEATLGFLQANRGVLFDAELVDVVADLVDEGSFTL